MEKPRVNLFVYQFLRRRRNNARLPSKLSSVVLVSGTGAKLS
jgi:hypothetical protein